MRDERSEVSVTFDERHGYIGSAREPRSAVVALSLGGLRRKIEALMVPDDVHVVLQLDGHAAAHPDLVIAVMNAASRGWATCANTVGPSCFTGARCTIVGPSQLPFGRLIERFIFWMCELSHTWTQLSSARYRNASTGLSASGFCISSRTISVRWRMGI